MCPWVFGSLKNLRWLLVGSLKNLSIKLRILTNIVLYILVLSLKNLSDGQYFHAYLVSVSMPRTGSRLAF